MTLATNLVGLAQAMGRGTKEVQTLLNGNAPTNAALDTQAKGNLVEAINEVKANADALALAADALTPPSLDYARPAMAGARPYALGI